MGRMYASGKNTPGLCDVCGFRYKLRELRHVFVKGRRTETRACPECWDKDHPQLRLGEFPVYDPQAIRNPRSDRGELAAVRAIVVPLQGQCSTAFVGQFNVGT